MVDGIKILPHIALENPARPRVVVAFRPQHLRKRMGAFVVAFANTAGERGRDKGRLKNRIEYSKNGMVQNAVPHRRLVDVTQFWITDIKAAVRPVSIGVAEEVTPQVENVLLKPKLKRNNIIFAAFATLELIPRKKKVLRGDNLIK